MPSYAMMGALTTGISAGREASKEVKSKNEKLAVPSESAIKEAEEMIFAPLLRDKGIPWQEFELKRQDTMSRYLGIGRTEQGMLQAVRDLNAMDSMLETIKANVLLQQENLHSYECVRRGLDDGSLSTHAWVYDLHNGSLMAYDPAAGEWGRL